MALSDDFRPVRRRASGGNAGRLHGQLGCNCPMASATLPMACRRSKPALQEAGAGQRAAQNAAADFVSVICLAWPDGEANYYRGEVEGEIVWPPRGIAGFGFDPVFRPEGYATTFGEMTAEQKHGWKPGDELALSTVPAPFSYLPKIVWTLHES